MKHLLIALALIVSWTAAVHATKRDSVNEIFHMPPTLSFAPQDLNYALPNVSQGCRIEAGKILNNTRQLIPYFDAIGKPGSGLLQGNQLMLGSFQECKQLGDSHYCSTSYNVTIATTNSTKISLTPFIGLCAPKQCSPKDVEIVFDYIVKAAGLSRQIHPSPAFELTYGSAFVCMPLERTISNGAAVTIFVCSVFLFLAFVGTIIDLMLPTNFVKSIRQAAFQRVETQSDGAAAVSTESEGDQTEDGDATSSKAPVSMLVGVASSTSNWLLDFILCFSATKNASVIFRTDSPPGAINVLSGLRMFSMWWVIFGHTFSFTVQLSDNVPYIFTLFQRFTFLPVVNGTFSVDSFFFLSGLLVSYLTLRRVSAKGGFPWLQYYLHRFLRLTPAYMFVILFAIYIYPMMGEGPLWFMQRVTSEGCKKYWWTNLLYINNFYPTESLMPCIGWGWYLANDMQFYIISPVIIIAMARYKTIGAVVSSGTLLIAGFISTAVVIDYFGLMTDIASPHSILNTKLMTMYMKYIYIKPYCRISPYIVGLFLGFILFRKIVPPKRYRVSFMSLGWCVGAVVGMATIWGNWNDYKAGGTPMTHVGSVFYGTFSRFSWGCFLAWLVYACHIGYGGLLNRFLSWRAFIPLSRLTYSAYLVHPLVMYVYISSHQVAFHYTDLNIAYLFASFVTLAYAVGFVLALFVEYPLLNVEQLIFKRK